MAYNIYKSDGTTVSVPDGAVDQAFNDTTVNGGKGLGIQIIGDNSPTYVAPIAQSFLQITENFCGTNMPSDGTALQGQLWFQQLSPTDGNLYVKSNGSTFGGALNWKQIALGTTTVTPGTYNYASFTVDPFGRITGASSNALGTGSVTSIDVAGTTGISSIGGPVTTAGTITLSLGNITPESVSTIGNLTFSGIGSNQRILGDFSSEITVNGTMSRTAFQTTSLNNDTLISLLPNGSGMLTAIQLENKSGALADSAYLQIYNDRSLGYYGIEGNIRGSGAYQTFHINNGGVNAISINTSGNVSIPTSLDVTGNILASNLSGNNTGDQTFTLTGAVTGSGTGSIVTTLSNTTVNPGSYKVADITVDATGRITSASSGIDSINVFTKNQSVQMVTLTDSATVTLDASLSNNFELQATAAIGATRVISNPINATPGMELNFWIYQDATGGENITWGNLYKFPGGVPYTSTLTANAVDFYKMNYSGTKNIWLITQQANIS